MYKRIIRPILFLLSPETVHHLIMWMMRLMRWIPGAMPLARWCFTIRHPALEREVFGKKFPNPIGLAAGFDKDAEVYRQLSCFGFGYVEIGTVTPLAQSGNPRPRLFRLPQDGALINRMGFNNKGLEHALQKLARRNRCKHCGKQVILGGNLGKNTATPNENAPGDYLKLFRSMYDHADYFVVNVSCPNVKDITCLQTKKSITDILDPMIEFRRGQNEYRPILIKISPDLTFEVIDDIVEILKTTGLDGIVAVNTTTSREGLITPDENIEAIGNGGLSGAPLTERALEVVRYVNEKTEGRFPIIGVGGIMTEDDALAMLDAGASLIQVYSGFIYQGPGFARRICKRIIARSKK